MGQVGRNDPCPCGSGKKYKKCCGKNNVVNIDRLLEREILAQQDKIIDFALINYGQEITEIISVYLEEMDIPEEVEELFTFLMDRWIIFDVPIDSENKIIDVYIKESLKSIKRPKLKEIILSWNRGRPIIGELISKKGEFFLLADIISDQTFKVKVLDDSPHQPETGTIIIGIIVPIGSDEFTFFTTFIDVPEELGFSFMQDIREFYHSDRSADSPEKFLSDKFPALLGFAFLEREITAETMIWESYHQQLVAEIFQKGMEQLGHDHVFIEMGLMLWQRYCEYEEPIINKPSVYAAALHYLVDHFAFGEMTQKELAGMYQVSTSGLSQKYRHIKEVLEDELEMIMNELEKIIAGNLVDEDGVETIPFTRLEMERHLLEITRDIEGKEFDSIEDINAYLNQPNRKKRKTAADKEKAQDIIFDAYNAKGKRRKELLKKALKLDPNHPDIYNIMGDDATSLKEANAFYREGVVRGEKQLGQAYFKENMGHFWGIIETRPFMRAKFNYGQTLEALGKLKEAIVQYEELLALDEMDHQAVRYLLFAAYVKDGKLSQAERLLKKYPEEHNAHGLFNRCLLEGLKNGKTERYKKLMDKAKKQNPFVMDYLTQKRSLPKLMPETYILGDKSEAIIYADLCGELWQKSGLL